MSFMDDALAGKLQDPLADIDDYIDQWHDGGGFDQHLHTWLGLIWEEYAAWVTDPNTLLDIIESKRPKLPGQGQSERSEPAQAPTEGHPGPVAKPQGPISLPVRRD